MQRTRLSCEDIARILDRGLAVNTGRVPGFNRNHLLFYSAPDDNFFVPIQDELTGTVVTILPLDYQETLAWKVSKEDCAKARELVLRAPKEENSQQAASLAKAFVISSYFLDGEGNQKAKAILKIAAAPYQHDVKALLDDTSLFARLDELTKASGIECRTILGYSVRLGNHGTPIAIDYGEI